MDKIEKVARAMCVADGNDPDGNAPAFSTPDENLSGGDYYSGPYAPKWKQYASMARRLAVAIEVTNAIR